MSSVVIFRRGSGRRPRAQVDLLLEQVLRIEEPLENGSVVVEEGRLRIRTLPISGRTDRKDWRTSDPAHLPVSGVGSRSPDLARWRAQRSFGKDTQYRLPPECPVPAYILSGAFTPKSPSAMRSTFLVAAHRASLRCLSSSSSTRTWCTV